MTLKQSIVAFLAISAAIAIFVACGSESTESQQSLRAELSCDELVCSLLTWQASDIYVKAADDPEDSDTFSPLWKEEVGYVVPNTRRTYRFPAPPEDYVVVEACDLEGTCVFVSDTTARD